MNEQAVAYLIGLALVLAFLFAAIKASRRPAVQHEDDRMAAIDRRLSAAERQLNVITVTIQHLPTAETVNTMAARIADIGGDVKALQASIQANNRLVERIDQHLLTKGA